MDNKYYGTTRKEKLGDCKGFLNRYFLLWIRLCISMRKDFGPFQKVVVTEQTTNKYGVVMYEVEKSENGYMYGVDEVKEHFYVDEVEFEDNLSGKNVKESETIHSHNVFGRVTIESKSIHVRRESNNNNTVANISWSSDKNSMYEQL